MNTRAVAVVDTSKRVIHPMRFRFGHGFSAILVMVALFATGFVPSILAADLDPAYVSTYGWGSLLVSAKGFLEKAKYDPAQIEMKDGAFLVPASSPFHLRLLGKDGVLFKDRFARLEESIVGGTEEIVESEMLHLSIWTSHDEKGNLNPGTWPLAISELPEWNSFAEVSYYAGNLLDLNTGGYRWDELIRLCPKLPIWLGTAPKDAKLRLIIRAGIRVEKAGSAVASEPETLPAASASSPVTNVPASGVPGVNSASGTFASESADIADAHHHDEDKSRLVYSEPLGACTIILK
ncbi:MAG: hypothetical protein WA705_23275 [Candidatus Ozemobacteraceae bacterium]